MLTWSLFLIFFGWVLAVVFQLFCDWRTKIREEAKEEKRETNARLMIQTEIYHNTKKILLFQRNTIGCKSEDEPNGKAVASPIELLRKTPFPEWNRSLLDSQLPYLPNLLSETEIERILKFYDGLRNLKTSHAEFPKSPKNYELRRKSFNSFQKKLTEWLKMGNPLG